MYLHTTIVVMHESYACRRWWMASSNASKARSVRSDRDASVGAPWRVLTHGEPHGANVLLGEGGLSLVDWDTVGIAEPERDLWFAVIDEDRPPA
jgi:aminoglycoside phosphotransferase (APT) family kinase protein